MANITHKLTLSTTEPNNDIGLLKVRHADEETQVLDVTITENGVIKSFTGLTPFFCLMAREITGQGVSEEKIDTYSASSGKLQYTMSANAYQMIGKNEAYFSFRAENPDGSWAEQFSTRSFYYTVEKSIYSEPFKDSNYFWTFSDLYKRMQNYWTSVRNVVESIKDGVIGDLVDAHTDTDGNQYDNLSARLSAQIGKNSNFRSWDKSLIDKMANESAERGINVKWFGAIGDGVTDDTQAFIDAIAYSHKLAVETNLIKNYPVVVPSGIYLLNPVESIRVAMFTRLLGIGKPIIKTDFEGSLFWFCPLGTDPDFSAYMNMQQYTNTPLLENFHFTQNTRKPEGSKTGAALEFGERENVLSWRYATSS